MTLRSADTSIWSPNEGAWALARAERRRGEEIRRARILITGERE